jgi:hypothetical protein
MVAKKKEEKDVYAEIAEAFAVEEEAIFEKPNVVGVASGHKITKGVDTGKPCIVVFVTQKLPPEELRMDDKIDSEISGYETDVIETGEIFAGPDTTLDDEVSIEEELGIEVLRQRVRPVMGGFSVGHPRITCGTIGTCVYRGPVPGIPRKYYILSNNHVLANSNNARIGDPILQPGRCDGGTIPRDIVARLSYYVPIRWKTPTYTPINYVDAAIAEGPFHMLNREIYWIGYVKRVNSRPRVGQIVEKTGRTTNFTTGKILGLNATVNVNYRGPVARFARQIVTTRMSAGGDSGSLVCDTNEGAVGLLFAGSPSITVLNRIDYVQRFLGGIKLHP